MVRARAANGVEAEATLPHSGKKLPKTPAAAGDLLYQLREARIAMAHEVEEMQKDEAVLRDYIIASLPKSDATGVKGKVAQVSIKTKTKPTAKDWTKIWTYIVKTKSYDMLQRRLNETAVASRWEDGVDIPGVDRFEVTEVSCTKIGGGK